LRRRPRAASSGRRQPGYSHRRSRRGAAYPAGGRPGRLAGSPLPLVLSRTTREKSACSSCGACPRPLPSRWWSSDTASRAICSCQFRLAERAAGGDPAALALLADLVRLAVSPAAVPAAAPGATP